MKNSYESLQPELDPVAVLRVESDRITSLANFLGEALPKVNDVETINTQLSDQGRPDLTMTQQAAMYDQGSPSDVRRHANNFTPNFCLHTGAHRISDPEYPDERVFRPLILTAITESEMDGLAKDSFTYKSPGGSDHSYRPAFIRMLVLFPEFTKNLVLSVSGSSSKSALSDFQNEIFVAHKLMAKLVDVKDDGVVDEHGTVDQAYLQR